MPSWFGSSSNNNISTNSKSSTTASTTSGGGGMWGAVFNGILSGISASAKGKEGQRNHAQDIEMVKQTGHQQRLSTQFERELDEYNKDINKRRVYDAAKSTYGKMSSLDRFMPNYTSTYTGPEVRKGPSSPDY